MDGFERSNKEETMAELHEECGVFGIYSPADARVADICYYGLFALQHRELTMSPTPFRTMLGR